MPRMKCVVIISTQNEMRYKQLNIADVLNKKNGNIHHIVIGANGATSVKHILMIVMAMSTIRNSSEA